VGEGRRPTLRRRTLLGAAGAAGTAGLAGTGLAVGAAGCNLQDPGGSSAGGTIRIGYVSPKTGDLAVFGESNDYLFGVVRAAVKNGLDIGGRRWTVEIVDKDTQSSASRAAQVAAELVNQGVDLVLASSTPDTVNPVSDQCESAKVPCLSTICPWEMWFTRRGGSATKTFDYTYLYFIGAEAEAEVFTALWGRAPGAHVVGGLWPNDVDGEVYRQFVPAKVRAAGWRVADAGAYQDGTQDFTSVINGFKSGGVDVLQATPIPPDLITFLRQADQNRFKPKIVCVAKALLFATVAQALGPLANNVTAPVWWNPAVPYTSSLDGKTAQQYADGYQSATGRQWTQPMGFNHAIFEIGIAALKASGDPKNRKAVADAIGKAKGEAITGRYDFTAGPVKNVCAAPDLLGQWRVGTDGKPKLVVVDNSRDPSVPVQGDFQPMT
jgi:branched-chain amino acid transport system substrate-binding protein